MPAQIVKNRKMSRSGQGFPLVRARGSKKQYGRGAAAQAAVPQPPGATPEECCRQRLMLIDGAGRNLRYCASRHGRRTPRHVRDALHGNRPGNFGDVSMVLVCCRPEVGPH